MEKELNIAAILKDKPVGLKFYSPTFGCISFNGVHKGKVYFFSDDTNAHSVKQNGKMYDGGECIIFPSKEMRDWEKFAWKKGDVLIGDCGFVCIFKEWASDDYTKFNGCYFDGMPNAETAKYSKLDNNTAYCYIREIENRCGGKLNLETLKIEKAQPEFKDGDIVVYKCEIDDVPSTIFIFRGISQRTPYYSYYASLDSDGYLSYKLGKFGIYNRELRLATEEEKLQLFDALAKKGKQWDAKKKKIVDLKQKVELKPFDKVLVRDDKEDQWSANIFSYQVRDMFHCLGEGYWRYCIPYEGNEHLLGTTKDVED